MIQANLKWWHKRRLLKLADHIEKLDPRLLNMSKFRETGKNSLNCCGTVGCILGHAPAVMRQMRIPVPMESDESTRIDFMAVGLQFGIEYHAARDNSAVWKYLFSEKWAKIDNTVSGAAKRIRWVVKHNGVPDTWLAELEGRRIPLSYYEEVYKYDA